MDGLICAFAVLANGDARPLSGPDDTIHPEEWKWLHLDRNGSDTEAWLRQAPFHDPREADVLLSVETRPAFVRDSDDPRDGATLILRGVNLNPGAGAHEMISLRLFIDSQTIITLRRDRVFTVNDLRELYEAGNGPKTPAHFVEALVTGLTARITQTVRDLEDKLDLLEERMTNETDETLRQDLIELRRQIIPIRRYVLPQRDALTLLAVESNCWTQPDENDDMERSAAETTRLIESLDALRERAGLLQEQISSELADKMNRNTYALSIVAAIFLPLGFLTGLLGINVGGMPGVESPVAFWLVVVLCIASAIFVIFVLKKMRLM